MTTDRDRALPRYDLVTPMIPCRDEILAGVERLLATGSYILGEEVAALESEMADACGCADAVGVSSGSDALLLALQAAGVGPGDEVVTTPYTFVATIEAILRLGATPVLVDIDPADLNIRPDLVAAAVTERTRAVLPVHLFGAPCRMEELLAAAGDAAVIEDMCQAFGAHHRGRPCGSFGRLGCLSFYPTKNLPGIGDGGMILCRDAADAAALRGLRNHGALREGGRLVPGWNSRLAEIQALAIRIRLARFADEQADRERAAAVYDEAVPPPHRLAPAPGDRVTHHQYWIRVPDRGTLMARLDAAGVPYGVYYDPPLHRHELGELCRVHGSVEESDRAAREILTLPIHQALSDADARDIAAIVREHLDA